MKTNTILSICISLFLGLTGCIPLQTINGDGNIVTKEIKIGNYETLSASGGKMVIHYIQSEDNSELKVIMDQNIFDLYEFREENGKLIIKPKKKYEKMYRLKPTEFTIITHSAKIKKFDIAGSNTLNIDSPLNTEKLKFNIAGSGHINIPGRADIQTLETEIAGSGTLNAPEIICSVFDAEIAGSGTLNLGGEATKTKLSVAGSGKMKAFDFNTKEIYCSIAGSGYVETSVSDKIDVEIAGSGNIRYKGNPNEIKKSIAGSGSIKKVD